MVYKYGSLFFRMDKLEGRGGWAVAAQNDQPGTNRLEIASGLKSRDAAQMVMSMWAKDKLRYRALEALFGGMFDRG